MDFWSKVDRRGPDECWPWLGPINRDGYGRFGAAMAHRAAFELVYGPIPPAHDVDHTCFVRSCVHPGHLVALPARVNRRRQRSALRTACSAGHPRTEANTYISPTGRRTCRPCTARRQREYQQRRAA